MEHLSIILVSLDEVSFPIPFVLALIDVSQRERSTTTIIFPLVCASDRKSQLFAFSLRVPRWCAVEHRLRLLLLLLLSAAAAVR